MAADGVSKMGLCALTKVLAREESGQIMVNSADPGYCATDQNQNQGYVSAAQGAVTSETTSGLISAVLGSYHVTNSVV